MRDGVRARRSRSPSSSAPRSSTCSAAARRRTRCPPTTSSRRPRRRRTSPASTASATACASSADDLRRHVHADPRATASAPRSSAASCSAPTRSRRGYYDAYYGRAQKVRTLIAEDFRGAFERCRPDRHADGAERRVQARREDRRSARDVPERRLHGADVARRHPGDLDPVGAASPTGCPSGCSCVGAARSSENRAARAAHALEQALAFDGSAAGMTRDAYEPVIGLEIHVQLQTRTKMFCGCELSVRRRRPTRTPARSASACRARCRSSTREAIDYAMRIGLALGCEIAPRSIFHRKNYFYPDLPKGYQITQYDEPICGERRIARRACASHRAHIEEDAAKLIHVGDERAASTAPSALGRRLQPRRHAARRDRHRAGHALAGAGARVADAAARRRCAQLGVSDVNMEEGSLRCDANVSIRPVGETSSAPRPS